MDRCSAARAIWLAVVRRHAWGSLAFSGSGFRRPSSRRKTRATWRSSVQLPDAASLQRTEAAVAAHREGSSAPSRRCGTSWRSSGWISSRQSSATNGATVFLNLKPWEERSPSTTRSTPIAARINGKLFAMQRRHRVRLQPARGAGARHHGRRRDQPAEPQRAGHPRRSRSTCSEFRQAVNQLPAAARSTRRSAPTCRRSTSTVDRDGGQGARRQPHRFVRDAAGNSLVAVHQRLQPVRQDVPRAGRGAAAVPANAGRHRQAIRARVEQRDGSGVGAGDDDELPQRADGRSRDSTGSPRRSSPGTPKPGHSSGELLTEVDQLVPTQFASAGSSACPTRDSRSRSARRAAARRWSSCSGLVMVFLVLAAQYESWSRAVRGAARRAVRRARRAARHLAPRHAERHLLPGRADHGRRSRGEERDPDRRIRQRAARARHVAFARRRSRRRASASGRSS